VFNKKLFRSTTEQRISFFFLSFGELEGVWRWLGKTITSLKGEEDELPLTRES
jgi:hypothetical protein